MFRLIFITLYISQYIFFTNGQNVQSKPAQYACVPNAVALSCMAGYVVVVKNAFYGVAQIPGSCTYTPGDCTADAMSVVTCLVDSISCSVFATKRRLSQCNDDYSSYAQIEYDCVPIEMNDPAKIYTVCQNNTEITSDNGIIRSPGYPTQFEVTTTECFRALHVPNDKTIRLWLTDLYIGSSSTNCADDHVFVADSIQTHKHCGRKRYAYPYLCSSTIIIQYLIKTKLSIYKGMRMYFEVVNRPANDNCPSQNVTVTPAPAITTTITIDPDVTTTQSTYVALGIASPVISFQLCKIQFRLIACPDGYGIAVTKNIFGVTKSGQCEPYDAAKHCVLTTDPTLVCKQRCTYSYLGNKVISTCENKTATYQYVEYQCIPTNAELISPNTPCPTNGSKTSISINRRGRFQNYNYPTLQPMNCTYRLKANLGYIMRIYSLDISLNDYSATCTSNKVSFIEDDEQGQSADFCEQRAYALIFSSCSNELDLRYVVQDNKQISHGVDLYIETQLRPSDWHCGTPISPATNPTTRLTTTFTFPPSTLISSNGFMGALTEVEYDICFGLSLAYTCPAGYTFITLGAYYGVKKQASNKCGFIQGDCVQEAASTITSCQTDGTSCYLAHGTRRRLAHCSDNYADYLHITYQCVPSRPVGIGSSLRTYDICSTTDSIADFNGVITSPGFPSYRQTTNECKRTLVGITDRVLKIWILEMSVSSGSRRSLSDELDKPDVIIHKKHETDDIEQMYPAIRDVCVRDYLIVNAPHVAHVYCGKRKLVLEPICATSVTIQYKATSPPAGLYRGFKFYFEWVAKPTDIFCGGSGSTFDPLASTTPDNKPLDPWAQNLQLSPILSLHVCLGEIATLRCPRSSDYALAVIDSNYGVTGTGLCEIPSSSHCHQEASLDLSCTPSCLIEYDIPKPLVQCEMNNADYLNIDYECIPTRLPNNDNPIDICASIPTDTIAMNSGIMISPGYPTSGAARTCSKRIETLPGKLWMVYIVDLFLEGENDFGNCDAASLIINDGNEKVIRCGLHRPELVLISCTNIVQFNFVSTHQALGYRGFKVFFQTIDAPGGWSCVSSFASTTTARPSTTLASVPPSPFIVAYGGTTNGTRQYCTFPFTYQNSQYISCARLTPPAPTIPQLANEPWCSLTSNYDTDFQWGFCNLTVTDSTFYDICRNQSQELTCPLGYVINIITASHAAKQNGNIGQGSCSYSQNDCFQSYASTIQTICAGKPSCTITHIPKTLASCYSRPSGYLHINYACIPNTIQDIPTYDLCNNNSLPQNHVHRGFIVSPNFPNTPNNIDCTFKLNASRPHQDIYLYVIDLDLNSPNLLGEKCVKDRLIVGSENGEREMCGRLYTDLLVSTCHTSISLRLIRTLDVTGRGVKFYFEFRDRPANQYCEPLISTTTNAPTPLSTTTDTASSMFPGTSSPTPIATTIISRPSYFPDPSPRMIQTLCYPDVSASFGTNNFQCPKDYIIVIYRAFYGTGSRCDYTSGDCTSEAEIVSQTCAGKQACSVPFTNLVPLPECNKVAARYLLVEYQCLPTPQIAQNIGELCVPQIDLASEVSGLLKSPSYPTYTQTQCENVTLSSIDGSNLVIYLYLLDMNINSPNLNTGECRDDYLLLSYQCNNQSYTERICGTHQTKILLATCISSDKIFVSYNLLSEDNLQRGFALLYHLLPRFIDPITTTSTTTRLTTITTRPTTTTTTLPPGAGPLSQPVLTSTTCVQKAIILACDIPNYVLVLHKVQLLVSATNTCTYSPTDCFDDRINSYNNCGGLASCYIFPLLVPIQKCNNSRSTYLYAEYQCIPKRPKLNLDVSSLPTGSIQKVEGGAMISSLNYAAERKDWTVILQSNPLLGTQIHKAFHVYILTLNLPLRATVREQGPQCNDYDPFIEINDTESGVKRLCGTIHTRYLFETCSNTITVKYSNFNTGLTARFKGFEIYFESISNEQCRPPPTPLNSSLPLVINNKIACALSNGNERVDFSCTPSHGLVFLQSYQFITKEPAKCNLSDYVCSYPSEQPQAQCSGQQECSYAHFDQIGPQLNPCQNTRADSIQFYYQCLPMKTVPSYSTFKFGTHRTVNTVSGFIETPDFPASYQQGRLQHSLLIPLPNNAEGREYSVYLYIIELSIRDTSIINPLSASECIDSITYTDGNTTYPLCGDFDQPVFKYRTNKKELNLTLNMLISGSLPTAEENSWRGARLFFIVGNLSLPPPPSSLLSTVAPSSTTPTITVAEIITTTPKKSNHGGVIAGVIIGVLLALLAVTGFILYRRRIRLQSNETHKVEYNISKDAIDSTMTNGTSEKRGSIPAASLKGPATSTFVSPFFKKPDTTAIQETDNSTEA